MDSREAVVPREGCATGTMTAVVPAERAALIACCGSPR